MKKKLNILTAIKPWFIKHSNSIMTGTGMCLAIVSVGHTVYATAKSYKKVQTLPDDKKNQKKEIIKVVWKEYIPPVVEIITAEVLIFGGFKAESKKAAAFSLAYSAAETALTEYQEATKEVVGKQKEQIIHEKASEKTVNNIPSQTVQTMPILEDGYIWFIDDLTRQKPFKSTWNDIRSSMNDMNARINNSCEGLVTVNEWLEYIGLEPVVDGDYRGWKWDYPMDISLDSTCRDGRVFGLIHYNKRPIEI